MTTTTAEPLAVTIDRAEPRRLAGFRSAVLGYETRYADDAYAGIGDGTHTPCFTRVPGREPAAWPGPGKRFHLDLRVPDVDAAVKEYPEPGATRPGFQPGGERWTVLADPEGHLFRVCPQAPEAT